MQLLNRLHDYDQRAFLWCADVLNYQALIKFARMITRTGDGYLQIILPFTILAIVGREQVSEYIVAVITAFVIERICYLVLKKGLKRRRPPQVFPFFQASINAPDEFSFPSGHTSAAFLLAILTMFYFPVLALPLLVWAVMVGMSRVILGVHFPADVFAGMSLGLGIGCYVKFFLFS